MEIVTGKAGVPHVSSADDGRRIAGEVGTGSYVLQTGGKLAPSLVDANTVRIATGDMIVQGRHIGVTSPEDVKVASGSQGKKRMDYICVHYTRDVSGSSPTLVETVEWKVLQGTPGSSAAAPSVPKGSILDGDADVTVPICSVTFDGLTTGQPKLLIPKLTPLADLGDSVSPSYLGGGNVGLLGCTVKADCWIVATCILIVRFSYVSGSMSSSDACELSSGAALVLPERLRPKSNILTMAFTSKRFGKSVGAVVEPSGAVKLYFSTRSEIYGYGFENCACCIPLAI